MSPPGGVLNRVRLHSQPIHVVQNTPTVRGKAPAVPPPHRCRPQPTPVVSRCWTQAARETVRLTAFTGLSPSCSPWGVPSLAYKELLHFLSSNVRYPLAFRIPQFPPRTCG